MRKSDSLCKRLTIFIAVGLATANAHAQEAIGDKQPSVYKLDSSNNARFQLEGKKNDTPKNGGVDKLPMPARLAAQPYAATIYKAAHDASLDPALVHAVIQVESGYNAKALSPRGAIGLMQLLPETSMRYGVRDPRRSPEDNIRAGTRYLNDLMKQFGGRIDLVLAAYNAGENAVVRHGMNIPPYPETRRYVPAVMAKYREWSEPALQEPLVPEYIQYLPGTRLDN